MYFREMRTSVDLPDDVLERIRDIAADRRTSVNNVIAELVTKAVRPAATTAGQRSRTDLLTGLKVLHLGRTVTTEEVRAAMEVE